MSKTKTKLKTLTDTKAWTPYGIEINKNYPTNFFDIIKNGRVWYNLLHITEDKRRLAFLNFLEDPYLTDAISYMIPTHSFIQIGYNQSILYRFEDNEMIDSIIALVSYYTLHCMCEFTITYSDVERYYTISKFGNIKELYWVIRKEFTKLYSDYNDQFENSYIQFTIFGREIEMCHTLFKEYIKNIPEIERYTVSANMEILLLQYLAATHNFIMYLYLGLTETAKEDYFRIRSLGDVRCHYLDIKGD